MKKNTKISKKITNILSILFLTIVSSIFFTSNAKAIYYDKGNGIESYITDSNTSFVNSIGDTYTYKINNEDFNETIKIEFKSDGLYFSSDYINNVPIFQTNDTSLLLNSAFVLVYSPEYDVMLVYLFYGVGVNDLSYFTSVMLSHNYEYFDLWSTNLSLTRYTTSTPTRIKFGYNSNHTYNSSSSTSSSAYYGFDWSVYGSNKKVYATTGNFYYQKKDDKIPKIDFTYNNNITTINDTNYVISKDVTMSVSNYNIDTHLLQYQFVKENENLSDNWITHTFANNENTLTLNYKENGSLYTRVLDIENNYNLIYSNTFTFDDIDIIDYIPIDINYKNNYYNINNKDVLLSKDLSISADLFSSSYNIFQYQFVKTDDELTDNWITHTFANNINNLKLNIKENGTLYVRILNKNDNSLNSSNAFLIDDIYNTLSLKKNFNSGDGYSKDLYSLNIINYNYNSLNYDIPFRIQFGSNDFSDNYPYVSSIRGYYYNTITQEKTYDENVVIKDFSCQKTSYSETICEGVMTKKLNKPTYYEIIFANTDNYYLYYYDYFDNNYRNVDVITNLFKDYNKYYFDSNSNIAFISLKNINNTNKKGSLIIPYYYLNNDELNVKLRKFRLNDNTFLSEYSSYFLDDIYYKKFDFEIEDNYFPVLTNKKSSYCNTFYVNSDDIFDIALNYDGYFLNFNNNKLYTIFDITSLSLYNKETICYKEEPVYFYLHKDFKITFNVMNSDNNIVITDDEGNNIANIDSNVNSENLYSNDKSFFDSVGESFSYFSTPFKEIFNMISYFWNLLPIVLKLLFIFIFVILISLFIFKFIL